MDGVVDPNVFVGHGFTTDFGIEVIEGWSEEWEDVEAPVDPTGQPLPFVKCKFVFGCNKIADCSYEFGECVGGMVMDKELASTSIPMMVSVDPKICLLSLWGRLILSHSCRSFTRFEGMNLR